MMLDIPKCAGNRNGRPHFFKWKEDSYSKILICIYCGYFKDAEMKEEV